MTPVRPVGEKRRTAGQPREMPKRKARSLDRDATEPVGILPKVLAAVAVLVLVLVGVFLVGGEGKTPPSKSQPSAAKPTVTKSRAANRASTTAKPKDTRELKARRLFETATAHAKNHPNEFSRAIKLFSDVVKSAKGSRLKTDLRWLAQELNRVADDALPEPGDPELFPLPVGPGDQGLAH